MGSDKFLLFLSSKLFNIVHHPFFIRVLFSATHIICNIWLSMCSLLKIWLDSVRMGIIIVTVPLVCKKRTLGSYFLFYHYGTTYRVCNMAVNIHILSYYMLNMSWQQNMTEMVVIKNISERWQQEMATEDPILQNTYIHTYIYTYILTYFRVRHTHTILACTVETQNIYHFCIELKSSYSAITHNFFNNTSHYAFMHHYYYASFSPFTSRIMHCVIVTSYLKFFFPLYQHCILLHLFFLNFWVCILDSRSLHSIF